MARPNKIGIDYFSLDVHMDTKIKLVEAKFGLEGFAIVIKLYQHIYDQGYYCSWTEDDLLIFCLENNIDEELMTTLMEFLLTKNVFSEELYNKYSILTSSGIQKRYIDATQKRKEVTFIKEYLLVDITPRTYRESVKVNINRVNSDINSKKVDNNSQSKVKESKVNNTPPLSPSSTGEECANENSEESLLVKTATGETDENQGSYSKTRKKRKKTGLNKKQRELFNKFWETWPNKVSKGQAESVWSKLDPDEEFTDKIIQGVERAKKHDKRFVEGFIPHPSTWLNAKGWLDEFSNQKIRPSPESMASNGDSQPKYDYDEIERRLIAKSWGGG